MTMLNIERIDPWWRDCDTQSNLDAYLVKYAEYAEFVEYAKYAEYKDTQDSTHHFISSVRSSNSHPDLLVIQHPTFLDHTGPQHWTFTFWATTAI